ncbi:MAG: TIGR04282 family arsenosugar biosynthesis glycosyltransferase [Dehalococcoidia bacterium]|nr:TIGR04282 family arsenosugar biosynthesis glycosyltransferase [Dehalococcoidia bacterium]
MSRPALAIMARAPIPGQVKTRLQPYLTPQQSADLYLAFLQDTLEMAVSARACDVFLAFTPIDEELLFQGLVPASVGLFAQCDGDLGQRMCRIFQQLHQEGHSPVLIVGTDIPTLQPRHLTGALERLRDNAVCLGPSRDGGYYLIGAHDVHPRLFQGVPWGTATVLQATLERAKAAGLQVALLDACSDIDTVEDLRGLRQELEQLRQTPGAWVPRRTELRLREMRL